MRNAGEGCRQQLSRVAAEVAGAAEQRGLPLLALQLLHLSSAAAGAPGAAVDSMGTDGAAGADGEPTRAAQVVASEVGALQRQRLAAQALLLVREETAAPPWHHKVCALDVGPNVRRRRKSQTSFHYLTFRPRALTSIQVV